MTENVDQGRVPMPGRLKWILVFVYLQVVVNLGFGFLIRASIADAENNGEQLANPALANFGEYASFIAAVALLVAAVAITSGRAWGRILLVVLEALAIINGVVTLINGTPTALIGLVLGGLVISGLFQDGVSAWFDHKAYLRRSA
jgi:hypothetical protein